MTSNLENEKFAEKYLVGGVSSSIRKYKEIGHPIYFAKGEGVKVWDIEGKEYYDLDNSHGATILGHNHPKLRAAVEKALDMGVLCAYETEYQGKLAKKLSDMVPAIDLCRFTCSGTDAVMNSIRLARESTGKEKIIKFEGHFHGYFDYVMYSYNIMDSHTPPVERSGPAKRLIPYVQSGGIPKSIKNLIIVAPFNDLEALEKIIKEEKDEVAALVMEPINYNSGCIVPTKEYMKAVRKLTKENGILLIYDEVLSAFRTGPGCAQEYFDVVPDLCTIGKCVAGGFPLSVFGGKREYMNHVRPLGNSEHSGTYNGHLIPVLTALACLEEISSPGFYDHIYQIADRLYKGLDKIFADYHLGRIQGLGARFGMYFDVDEEVTNYRIAAKSNKEKNAKFIAAAVKNGVLMFGKHHGFSAAYTKEDVDEILNRLEKTAKEVADYYK